MSHLGVILDEDKSHLAERQKETKKEGERKKLVEPRRGTKRFKISTEAAQKMAPKQT